MTISRRDLLKGCGVSPVLLNQFLRGAGLASFLVEGAPAAIAGNFASHQISLGPRAVIMDGKPVFLIGGSMDYFRCPHQLWRDRLLRAKRAGLNTISTYVAWNFHEREEGIFDFEGDRDLGRFLDLCAELGLYAFPRVGPFICDEWDAGGYPAWLIGLPETETRTKHPPTMKFIERWFQKLIPIIAERQITRGGAVICVQQENEFFHVGRPGVAEYQDFLIDQLRKLSIDVPITDCNGSFAEIRRPTSLQTANGGGAENVRMLQKAHPDKPAIITELYTDYSNCWGWPISSYPSAEMVQQQTMETLAAGGMFSYFMFHGGTNFGFWASTTWKSDQSFITTRYYGRGPLAEGGALNETYYAVKAVNLLAQNFNALLAQGETALLPVSIGGPVRADAVRTPHGYLLFVHPRFPVHLDSVYHTDGKGPLIQLAEEWPMAEIAHQAGTLQLPSGESIDLGAPSSYPSMLPYQLEVGPDCRVDFSNATLLGVVGEQGRRVVIVRGEAGRRGIVSINGHRAEFLFSATEAHETHVGGTTVLALPLRLADRTWFADGRVIIGAAYVGEQKEHQHECFLDGESTSLLTVSAKGKIASHPVTTAATVSAQIPLAGWSSRPLPEVSESVGGWRELDQPRGVEDMKEYWGYTWYRASLPSSTKRTTGLIFTEAADRIHIFANGKRIGIWGRGPGALRDPLPVELAAGENHFVFLCDNMGRLSEGSCLDRKGIRGPAYLDAEVEPLPTPQWSTPSEPPSESWRYKTFRNFADKPIMARASYDILHKDGEGRMLSLRWFPQYAWVTVNGKLVGEHSGDLSLADGIDFKSFVLDSYLSPGHNQLEITIYGDAATQFETHVQLLKYCKQSRLKKWGFRAWSDPTASGDVAAGEPTWWECDLVRPTVEGPLFLVVEGLSKGQVFLNEYPVGRYWEIGPQHSLYLPEPWFKAHNRVAILDEEGRKPERVYLMRDSRVPIQSVLI